ncbi:MAG: TdeIII family type II restriction endonuclease [Acidobacteriota bacterium]
MPLDENKRQRIQNVVKKILTKRRGKFPVDDSDNRNAPFHEIFLTAFEEHLRPYNIPIPKLISLTSWLHGLNTSLGTGFEHLASILNGGMKRKFTEGATLHITTIQSKRITEIVNGLKRNGNPNLQRENDLLFSEEAMQGERQEALGFTADNYIETATFIQAIELKTVRPNSGVGIGEKQKILNAKAAFKLLCPTKEVRFYMGFPFDPTSSTPAGYDKESFFRYLVEFKKFFAPDEVLIGGELWDHLSGQSNTMESILEIVRETVQNIQTR